MLKAGARLHDGCVQHQSQPASQAPSHGEGPRTTIWCTASILRQVEARCTCRECLVFRSLYLNRLSRCLICCHGAFLPRQRFRPRRSLHGSRVRMQARPLRKGFRSGGCFRRRRPTEICGVVIVDMDRLQQKMEACLFCCVSYDCCCSQGPAYASTPDSIAYTVYHI